jgi:hypothetical protein
MGRALNMHQLGSFIGKISWAEHSICTIQTAVYVRLHGQSIKYAPAKQVRLYGQSIEYAAARQFYR